MTRYQAEQKYLSLCEKLEDIEAELAYISMTNEQRQELKAQHKKISNSKKLRYYHNLAYC